MQDDTPQAPGTGLHLDDLVDRFPDRQTFCRFFRVGPDFTTIIPVGGPMPVSVWPLPENRPSDVDGAIFFEVACPVGSLPTGPVPDVHQRRYFGHRLTDEEAAQRGQYPHGAVRLSGGRIVALRPTDQVS